MNPAWSHLSSQWLCLMINVFLSKEESDKSTNEGIIALGSTKKARNVYIYNLVIFPGAVTTLTSGDEPFNVQFFFFLSHSSPFYKETLRTMDLRTNKNIIGVKAEDSCHGDIETKCSLLVGSKIANFPFDSWTSPLLLSGLFMMVLRLVIILWLFFYSCDTTKLSATQPQLEIYSWFERLKDIWVF